MHYSCSDDESMKFLILVMVVFILGCIPVASHYYEPTAQNATQIRQNCYSGAKSGIGFTRGNVNIITQSMYHRNAESYLLLDIQFHLSSQDNVDVHWNDMKITEKNNNSILFTLVPTIYAYNLPLTKADLVNARVPDFADMDGRKFTHYDVELNVAKQPSDEFVLKLPAMTINGVIYPATAIRYTKKFGVGIIPINC